MRLNLTLRRRVERVERRQRERRQLPTVVSGIYPEEQPGPIVGIKGGGKLVRLKPGETIDQLQRRALATLPGRFLQTLYAAPERASEPSPSPAPVNAPDDAPKPVPGVGRVATRDELIRAGVIPVPLERIV